MGIGFIVFQDGQCVIDVKKYEEKVSEFSRQICEDPEYVSYLTSQRRASPDKIKQNILDSKLPECAVNEYLISRGFPDVPTNPDFNVYKRGEKSWAPDLVYELDKPWAEVSESKSLNVAVKSCTLSTSLKYGCSFVFNIGVESKPNTIKDAVAGKKNAGLDELFISGSYKDVVAFVIFDKEQMQCEIRAFVNWSYLKSDYENAFSHMRLPKYKNIKTAIYDKYLRELGDEGSKEIVQTTIRLTEDLHTNARVYCLRNKITLNDLMVGLLKRELS